MKPASAKNKGRTLQKWVAEQLLERFPTLQKGDLRSTSMGVTGEDVTRSPYAKSLIPFQFECKSSAAFAGYKHMEQAEQHGEDTPVVVVKANRKKPLVILYAEDFFNIIKGQ